MSACVGADFRVVVIRRGLKMTEHILEHKTEQHLLAGTDTVRAEAQVVGPEGRQLPLKIA